MDSGLGTPPSQKRRASVPLMSPGFKAFAAGLSHSMYAQNVIDLTKKIMAPVTRQYKSGQKSYRRTVKKGIQLSKTKKAIISMAQTYNHYVTDSVVGNNNILHNVIYGYNMTSSLVQGSAVNQRQGDQIYLQNLKLKGFINSATASNSYTYRVLVGFSGEEYNTASLLPTNLGGANPAEIWLPTFLTSYTNGIVNSKAFTVLLDSTIDLNSQVSGASDLKSFEVTIPLYQKFQYQSAASVYGKTKNLYVVVTPFVVGGTGAVTSCGAVHIGANLSFKNL